jgi:alkylation response protein AidB-like acyl-CoA dehydrogenase
MRFDLTEEQKLLQQSVRKFLDSEMRPYAEEYADKMITKEVARPLLKKLLPFGYIVGAFPEEVGGMALDAVSQGILYEELFRVFPGLAGVAFITQECALSLYEGGSEEQIQRYLPRLLSAESIGCVAVTEPGVGSNPADLTMRAVPEGDFYRLNGEKIWISNGSISDVCIVLAKTGKEGKKSLSRFIVEKEPNGYTVRDLEKLGFTAWPTSELFFDNTLVPKENLLGRLGEGLKETLKAFERARCFVALAAIGVAQSALEAAIQYAQERKQWGKPIGQHQLIQEMIADMATELDAARLLTYRGLYLVGKGVRCDTQTSMAKWYATEAAVRITSHAIQIHGAYGLSKEFPVERYFRDARMLTIPDGSTQIQKLIIARNMLGMAAF